MRADIDPNRSLDCLAVAAAERSPQSIALHFAGRAIRYGELDRMANRIAHALLALGVAPGDRVGLWLKKSSAAVVFMQGILRARAAYVDLQESLDVDTVALHGRVIVIDPGHGGGFRGALGQDGLAESDVNLAVSLFLWGLLREAGAVILGKTVTTEFAFLNPANTSNPRDVSRTPGGSSSGSAAAVAAGR